MPRTAAPTAFTDEQQATLNALRDNTLTELTVPWDMNTDKNLMIPINGRWRTTEYFDALVEAIASGNSLKRVNVGGNALTDEACEKLCEALKHHKDLKVLDISRSELLNRGLETIAKYWPGLKALNVTRCQLHDPSFEGFTDLVALKAKSNVLGATSTQSLAAIKTLTALSAGENGMSDTGAQYLAYPESNVSVLDLSKTHIGPETVIRLARMKKLAALSIDDNANIKAADEAPLREKNLAGGFRNTQSVEAKIDAIFDRCSGLHTPENDLWAQPFASRIDQSNGASATLQQDGWTDAGAPGNTPYLKAPRGKLTPEQQTTVEEIISGKRRSLRIEASDWLHKEYRERLLDAVARGNSLEAVAAPHVTLYSEDCLRLVKALGKHPRMAHLNVTETNIDNAGIEAIAQNLPGLTTLLASVNIGVDDYGAKAIAGKLKNLIVLDLSNTLIGRAGVKAVLDNKNLPALKQVGVAAMDSPDNAARARMIEKRGLINLQDMLVAPRVHLIGQEDAARAAALDSQWSTRVTSRGGEFVQDGKGDWQQVVDYEKGQLPNPPKPGRN